MFHWRKREAPMWASLRAISESFRPGGIIDVGANVGDWAKHASQIFDCQIHMIEAQPELEKKLKSTGFPYTITLLGPEHRSSVPFHLTGTGSSVMEELTGFEKARVDLPMHRLDDLKIDLSSPLLMKLDVQGYELEVLKGASKTLGKTEVVLSEVSLLPYNKGAPLMHEVIAFLADRDFLPFDICGGWRRPDKAMVQADMIFVRKDSQLRGPAKFWSHEP